MEPYPSESLRRAESRQFSGGTGTIYGSRFWRPKDLIFAHASSAHYRGRVELQAIPRGRSLACGDELFNFGAFSDAQWAGFGLTRTRTKDLVVRGHVLFTVVSHNDVRSSFHQEAPIRRQRLMT